MSEGEFYLMHQRGAIRDKGHQMALRRKVWCRSSELAPMLDLEGRGKRREAEG